MTQDQGNAQDAVAAARLERALERLNTLVNWERRDKDAAMRRGLEPIEDILARLGNPERKWRAVHVAGTKGKGTTSSLIASALVHAGIRVGLYTSPHVSRVHERVRIDGRDVEDGVFASAIERALDAREGAITERERAIRAQELAIAEQEQTLAEREHATATRAPENSLPDQLRSAHATAPREPTNAPHDQPGREHAFDPGTAGADATWFDLITAAAFLIFAEARVEWAVIECGLGGRLDSTNVIAGEVCVVTNIDLEHTAVLGSTRAAIAREKAGILKRGSTLVTGVWPGITSASVKRTSESVEVDVPEPDHAENLDDDRVDLAPDDDAGRVIQEVADRLGSKVLRPERLAPTMLERNIALAGLVLDELGRRGVKTRAGKVFSIALLDAAAIEGARLPARSEKLWAGRTRVVLDGAHVASSVKMVLDELMLHPELIRPPIAVLALGRDKDAIGILKTLESRVDRLVCTTVTSGPLAAAENLAREAARVGIEAETVPDPARAFARALDLAQPEGWVLVIGSFYLAGALRSNLHPDPSAAWKTPRC